jgi:hypothetical protein
MKRLSRLVLLVVGAAPLVGVSSRGEAEIWNRTHADGTVEFTNRPHLTKGGGGPSPRLTGGGTFWSRERSDGVVEFTNQRPVGNNWKVWLKTGPGKAAALRGSTDVVPPRDGSPARYSRYDQDIHDQQLYYGIPEALIRAVMKVESDFDPHVVSSVGAQGLMQLMPDTARLMGVTDSFDGRQNIMGGARYLQTLARRFCRTPAVAAGDPNPGPTTAVAAQPTDRALVCSDEEKIKVLAGYHAGPGAVEKYGGMPPYETTRAYVTMVLRRYEQYRRGPAAHAGAFLTEQ